MVQATAVAVAEILGLGRSVHTERQLESAVLEGLPKRALEHLSSRLCADPRAARANQFRVVPAATWKRRTTRLSVGESERTERLARVLAEAEHVWDSREQAREWMHRPHPELQGNSPLETARTELGARRVEHLLQSFVYGLPV